MRNIWSRFRRDEGGNVFILFGATVIPLLLLMGGAVDLARYTRYKAELSSAVDSASLALAREGEDYTEAQAKTFVTSYVAGFSIDDNYFTVGDFNVQKTAKGFIVSVDGTMRTIFLPLGHVSKIDADISAEVVHASNQVELALVLDNTGSMNCGSVVSGSCTGNWQNPGSSSRISGLKSAAHSLIDTLMTNEDYIKVAVVPFEGAVNIKNSSLDYSWLDWQDTPQAKWNSANFDPLSTSVTTCTSGLFDRLPSLADLHLLPSLPQLAGLAGLGQLASLAGFSGFAESGLLGDFGGFGGLLARRGHHHGGGGGGGGGGTTCTTTTTTQPVSHKWLFDQLHAANSNVEWAGCVEMRAEPYDILDTPPDQSNPDTLFVPFFWPDEPDSGNNAGDYYTNNYLDDDTSGTPSDVQRSVDKYLTSDVSWQGSPDTTFPYTSGPNYGCPRPILPLTDNKSAVSSAIDDMIAYPAMGTYIPTGLVWGWHALTKNAPLTEGVGPGDENYDTTVKAIVLLTDGENSVTGMSNHNYSIFSGYNYTGTQVDGHSRLGSRNATAAQAQLDTQTRTLCTNIKNDGIRLYTITFGDIPNSAETLMRNCASVDKGETLYYHAPSNDELKDVFNSIGQDLSEIHLAM